MSVDYKLLRDYVNHNPLMLLTLNSAQEISFINSLLPYSVGVEIECNMGPNYNDKFFESIPYIMDVDIDNGEQRYRIPNGIHGILCLYFISIQLKKYSELNLSSGIHYHVDTTQFFHSLNSDSFIISNKRWILEELDSWNYKGHYNPRDIGEYRYWIRLNHGYKTMEFRIGEMTFDYEILIKRVLYVNKIVSKLASYLPSNYPIVYNHTIYNPKVFIDFMSNDIEYSIRISELNKKEQELLETIKTLRKSYEEIVNKRVIKLY